MASAAIEDYLSDDQHSVATVAKESTYLLEHDQAGGFKSAFPLFSGPLWTQPWLLLASLEAVILQGLYSQSPQAAIVIDNLNVLETVISDILAFPNVENRDELMDQAVALFTSKNADNAESMDYLLFALRGGIYNQGSPAVGELMQSERNRTRAAMDMQHNMIMSSPQ